MSSPRRKTVGSRSISSQIPWRMASRYVSMGMVRPHFVLAGCHLSLVISPLSIVETPLIPGGHSIAQSLNYSMPPPTLWPAIYSFQCRRTFGHRAGFGEGNGLINFFLDFLFKFLGALAREQPPRLQKLFELRDGIALGPFLQQAFGNIVGGVVRGVPRHAKRFALNKARTVPRAGILDGRAYRRVNRQYFIAIHRGSGHGIGSSTH